MALTLKALDHSGSRFLLQHYVQITAPRISGRVYPENPYITYILPLALSDDKIMQTVLAISGTHLMVHNPSVEHLMRSHYAVALRSVKHELTKYANGESSDVLKLLVTTLLLCQFECIDGKIHGELYHHLRASRELLLKLQKSKHPVDQNLHGFLLEQYAFLTIVAKITLRVDFQDREVAFDPLVFSLESINRDSNIYGTMFGCAHQLFELIPRISMLANQRLRENEEGISSFESIAQLRLLEDKIRSWDYSRDDSMRPEENYFALAGRIYQQAILAFLYTSFHGPKPPDADLLAKVEPCISDFLKFFLALPPNTSIWTTMMWPVITAGSCMRQPKQREYIFRALDKTPHLMFVCFRMKEILKWVWEDKSGESYGPYGIEMMMKRRNINICVG
ncbi:MAG: hypothetical protein M1834_003179 [Cirrosporium novae-zelandiae]|nr:MAG: hypothetical protein M1834_003179 [Cirrosporium novae-zelandiae]